MNTDTTPTRQMPAGSVRTGDVLIERTDDAVILDRITNVQTSTNGYPWIVFRSNRTVIYHDGDVRSVDNVISSAYGAECPVTISRPAVLS